MNFWGQYWVQAIGLFMQVIPALMIAFVPYDRSSFRFDRKRSIMGTFLLLVAMMICFPVIASFLPQERELSIDVYSDIYMVSVGVVFLILFSWLIQDTFIKKYFALLHSLFIIVVMLLVRSMLQNISVSVFAGGYRLWDLFLQLPIIVAISSVSYYIEHSILRNYYRAYDLEYTQRHSRFVAILFTIYFLSIGFYIVLLHGHTKAFMMMAPLFLFTGLILLFCYAFLMRESIIQNEKEQLRRINDTENMQFRKISNDMENARRQQHDLTHHLTLIFQKCQEKDIDGIEAYLDQIAKGNQLLLHQQFCQNPCVNSLLQYYISRAQENNIHTEVMVDLGKLQMDQNVLTILFGNTLENAILSNLAIPGDRWLRVKAELVGDRLAILEENACDHILPSAKYQSGEEYQRYDAFQSVRSTNHYGLSTVNAVCEKYGGSARFRYDEASHTFTTHLLLSTTPQKK